VGDAESQHGRRHAGRQHHPSLQDVQPGLGLRSTEPERLWDVADPVGPDNDDYIRELAKRSDLTLCAWGQPGPDRGRAHHVRGLIEGVSGAPSFLRQNKDGSPGHPLYLPGKLTPQVWV
jgi:hypothetical protein